MERIALFIVLALFLSLTWSLPPRHSKQYRLDYEYNGRTDSFYKLHTERKSSWQASKVCLAEGAALMVPGSPDDMKQLHGMFKNYPDLGDFVWVGLDGEKHESAEEHPLIYLNQEDDSTLDSHMCDVMGRHGEVDSYHCYQRLPFICKVKCDDAHYDSHCDVYANDYTYNSTVGSCYRVPRNVGTWSEAYAECHAENAHLAVLNSEAERVVVKDILKNTPKVQGALVSHFFYAGFRAVEPVGNETVVFKTIFNQTLEEAGFAVWSPGEPNNYQNNEYCGTIFQSDGKLNDVACTHDLAYICEKEKPSEA